MTAPSSWRRSFWRIGSMVAALVGSAVVVVAILRRAPAPRRSSDDRPTGTNGLDSPSAGSPPRPVASTTPEPRGLADVLKLAPPPAHRPGTDEGRPRVTGLWGEAVGADRSVPGPPPAPAATHAGPMAAPADGTPGAGGPVPGTGRVVQAAGDVPVDQRAPSAAPDGSSDTGPAGERAEGVSTEPVEGTPLSAASAVADAGVGADAGKGKRAEPGRNRGRRPALLAVAVGVVAVVGAVAVMAGAGGDDGPDTRSDARGSTAGQPSTTSVDQLTPDQAFTQAATRLTSAGSYGYHGTTSATDVSNVRPGPWLAVELTVMGQVDLTSGRWHELAVSSSTGEVAESVTDSLTLWARTAPSSDELPSVPFETIRTLADPAGGPVPTGVALLPGWLTATTNRVAEPAPDPAAGEAGRRTFRATLPAAALGEIETGRPPVDAEVRLTLDAGGNPVHVDVVSTPAGPPLHLALAIFRIGEPEPVTLPTEQPAAPTGEPATGTPDEAGTGTGLTGTTGATRTDPAGPSSEATAATGATGEPATDDTDPTGPAS